MLLCALTALCVVHGIASQHVDLTVSAGARGKDVVESVVERIRSNCIFADDRLFLRRLAYVESQDGQDPKTYRNDFHGGIWQVDEQMFSATRRCPFIIVDECNTIGTAFNISWAGTTWQDLRKPLYSGLAASLYMLLRLGFMKSMPGDLEAQADTWSHYYHLNNPNKDFVNGALAVKDDCQGKLDLAFIIDSSGSINSVDYFHMLMFVQNVTKSLNFGPDATQFAAINFGTRSSVSFYFDSHNKRQDVVDAISRIKKDNGGTYTYNALDLATNYVFKTNRGAREGIPRVVILLTDGGSASFNKTVTAADKVKQSGITIFSIGIGSVNRKELEAVASDPNCTHLFFLDTFDEIESLLNELRKSSCSAPTVLTGTDTGENSTGIGTGGITSVTEILTNVTKVIKTIMIDNQWTFTTGIEEIVKAEVTCGILDIYASYETPNPGPAFFQQKFTATDGHPAIISMVQSHGGRPLYITVIGTKLPSTPENLNDCLDAHYTISVTRKSDVEILCRENGELRQCTKTDYIHAELKPLICEENNWGEQFLTNPCTREMLDKGLYVHPHPINSNMFIKCDLTGRMYVTLCPENDIFNKDTMTCGFESVSVPTGGTALPSNIPSPCTPQKIQDNEYFFTYPDDKHKFIHCDVWGGAWVQPCKPNLVWNNIAKTCVEDFFHEFDPSTPAPVTIHNPCVPGASLLFHPHPDITKFIHCDVAGNYWVQSCPPGTRWEPTAHVCVPMGFQGR